MGRPGQRTLHPFFGKGSINPEIPSSETQPIQSEASSDQTGPNCEAGYTSGAVASGSESTHREVPCISAGREKRDRKSQLQGPSTFTDSNPIAKDDDANDGRRKRRKTTTPEPARPGKEGPLRRHFVKAYPNPLLVEQLEAAADGRANTPEQNPEPVADTGIHDLNAIPVCQEPIPPLLEPQHETKQQGTTEPNESKAKTLRLNPNGKLLSSPIRSKDEPFNAQKTTTRRKSTRNKRSRKSSALVTLKYGVDEDSRCSLGKLINEIITGQKRHSLAKETLPLSTPPPPPPPPASTKPTHPFFLGKAGQKTDQRNEQVEDSPIGHTTNASKEQSGVPNQFFGQSSRPSPIPSDRPRTPTVRRPLHPKSPDPIEPIWPPQEAVHVRGFTSDHGNSCSFMNFEEKKAKGSVPFVPQSESVLSIQSHIFHSHTKSETQKKTLRHPKKSVCSGDSVMGMVMNGLGLSSRSGRAAGEEASRQRTSMPFTSHPAVAQLLSSIRSSTTAFDRGEYDETPWTLKYTPNGADCVLQLGAEALVLKRWLQNLEISTVDTGGHNRDGQKSKQQNMESTTKRKKRRKRPKDLDQFIVSSDDDDPTMDELPLTDDEDELAGGVTIPNKRTVIRSDETTADRKSTSDKRPVANSILISGPSGCGKTAAVHAVAKELGFEIFEINPGSRRSARDVIERVGDMTQNHIVHLLGQVDENPTASSLKSMFSAPDNETGKQSSMKSFFKQRPGTTKKQSPNPVVTPASGASELSSKPKASQKQSLILLEEVDILFDEDKQFWTGVIALISQSKRPIIMTCNDESLIPFEGLNLHAILRFRPPPCDLAADYLFLLAAKEGHIVDRNRISELYSIMRQDLRATIMQLDFWCQMAVGSKKAGLDWLVKRPFLPGKFGETASVPKVISSDTYVHGMGWLSQDLALDENSPYERKTRLMLDCLDQWGIGLMDWQESEMFGGASSIVNERLDGREVLNDASRAADMRSSLDIISQGSPYEFTQDLLDSSLPEMTSKQRSTYTEGYQFLQTDLQTDYTYLSTKIGASITVLLDSTLHNGPSLTDDQATIIHQTLSRFIPRAPATITHSTLHSHLSPLTQNPDPFAPSTGRQSISFDNGIAPITEDIAPYVRAIVSADLRLEHHRMALSGLDPQGIPSNGAKRMRTTRASRAAMEGGSKASVRRERWFTGKLVPKYVLETGGDGWQELLLERIGGEKVEGDDGSVEDDGGDGEGEVESQGDLSSEGGI
ncbi:hypothetical protein FQN50_008862 [Emmonsiellopsis sp. PD_5]|nr:hypothetical protein FQN50_008862 [Emmonsiellopsis sp. PD_5]